MDSIGPESLSRLIDEHGAALVLYAQQWCNGPEDVVQEAFLRLMRQRPVPGNAVGWLYRVVRNEAISVSRSANRRARREAAAAAASEAWFDDSCSDAIDAAAATAALRSLPSVEREAIVLRLWGGLSFEEIAELIGTSTSTAHRRYTSALTALRKNWNISLPQSGTRQ